MRHRNHAQQAEWPTLLPLGSAALAALIALCSSEAVGSRAGLLTLLLSAALSLALMQLCVHLADRMFFPARAAYQPSIERLSAVLAATSDEASVVAAATAAIRDWLGGEQVQLTLSSSSDVSAPAERGVGTGLSIALEIGAELLGELRVATKGGGAIFNTADQELLEAVANLTALALLHARNRRALDTRRLRQAAAWKDERSLLVETFAAEVAHEMRCPLNFFGSVLRSPSTPQRFEIAPADLEIGAEEVERLDRMLTSLRSLAHATVERRRVELRALVGRAEALLAEEFAHCPLVSALTGPETIECDPEQATQILVNLLSNALEATAGSAPRQVGLDWSCGPQGACLCVWDNGPGFSGAARDLFRPWVSSKARGRGLGLSITRRLAEAHGWTLEGTRQDGRTAFTVRMPMCSASQAAENA